MKDPDLGILLALAYQEFVRQLHESLAHDGFDDLATSDGYVFRALDASPQTTSALANQLGISKQGTGQLVEDMVRRGYVQSRPDPRDRRARILELSERGRRALSAARSFHRKFETKLARRHGAASIDALRSLLEEMAPTDNQGGLDPRLRAMQL